MAQLETQGSQPSKVQLKTLPNGGAAAAILAACIGCLVLGILSLLANVFDPISKALQFYAPAGDITGVSTLAVIVWLIVWLGLHHLLKDRQVNFTRVFVIALLILLLGVVCTFPPFVTLFGSGG